MTPRPQYDLDTPIVDTWPEAIQIEAERPTYSARRVARWREEDAIVVALRFVCAVALIGVACALWTALPGGPS